MTGDRRDETPEDAPQEPEDERRGGQPPVQVERAVKQPPEKRG